MSRNSAAREINVPMRLILLGASNLTLSFPYVVKTASAMLGSPLEVFGCIGHGRSYGMSSTVIGRTLPAIIHCGLWDAVKTRPPASRCVALITDIGNDIMYGADPAQITQWIKQCVDHLQQHGARVSINALPIESIRAVRSWQYRIVKSMLFPSRKITFRQAIDRAVELHDRVAALARSEGLPLITCHRYWYGFDPIHIRRRHRRSAWQSIVHQSTGHEGAELAPNASIMSWIDWQKLRPAEYGVLGVHRSRIQPTGRLRDGSTIWLY
jgi:hypothetical protein